MRYPLLSGEDLGAIEALKEFHGGSRKIIETMKKKRDFETRKRILGEKGWGKIIEDAEHLVQNFPKVSAFEDDLKPLLYRDEYGLATSQVSGFQGARVTHRMMQRVAASAEKGEGDHCWVPSEMISVVALTDEYVYSGNLMATLYMAENIMKASKFCSTNLIGIPIRADRFRSLEEVTGKTFDRRDLGEGMEQLILKNMGTAFGNLGGVEVADDNHLVYLDGVIRAAMETGADFFLNPSWSTIIAACAFARDIPVLQFKVSMLLATQNLMQFRMLLNIISEYQRDDGTTPMYEINIGNGVSPENFILCAEELKTSGIKGLSLAAHLRINPDLGMEGFDWTENAIKVLKSGTDLTFKYESDGTSRELDTMGTYFLPDAEREALADKIGDVLYYKALRASKDGRNMIRRGIRTSFGGSAY